MLESERKTYYISRNGSDAGKGLAILLVIAAHNAILCTTSGTLQQWFYLFHVQFFFLIPFFYDVKTPMRRRDFLNPIIRCYVPYIWGFVITYLGYHLFIAPELNWRLQEIVPAFIYGQQWQLKEITGFYFLWFLPAFCSLTLLKNIFLIFPQYGKIILLSFVVLAVFPIAANQSVSKIFYWLYKMPFQLYHASYFFCMGILAYYVFQNIIMIRYGKLILLTMACIVFLYGTIAGYPNYGESHYLLRFLMPIAFLYIILLSENILKKSGFLQKLGQHSFVIYLVHVVVYNVFVRAAEFMHIKTNIFVGLIVFALTVFVSFAFSVVITNFPKIKTIFFPRGIR